MRRNTNTIITSGDVSPPPPLCQEQQHVGAILNSAVCEILEEGKRTGEKEKKRK
jgi:hypothetical protein